MKVYHETFTLPNGTILGGVHPSSNCAGEKCVIHNPMHTYDKADLIWRNDRCIFEVICAHGCGHPAPEQYEYWRRTNQEWQTVHGCDGCCANYHKEES